MGVITCNRSQRGPILEVELAPSRVLASYGAKSLPGASAQRVYLLLDTGADHSVIDDALNDGWGLVYTGGGWSKTLNATKPRRSIEVMLTLHAPGASRTFDPLTVSVRRGVFDDEPFKGLLGRDVLDQCVLVYDGPGHHFSLTFRE